MADTGSDNPADTGAASQGGFSQEDVDRLVGERLAKQERKFKAQFAKQTERVASEAVETFLADRGLDLETFDKAVEAPSEVDQLKRDHRALKAKHTKLDNELKAALDARDAANAQLRKIYGRDEVTRAASKLRAHNPDAVWKWVKDDIAFDDENKPFVIDSDGNPAGITIEQLIEGLRSNESTMFMFRPDEGVTGGGSRTTPIGSGANAPGRTKEQALQELAAIYADRD